MGPRTLQVSDLSTYTEWYRICTKPLHIVPYNLLCVYVCVFMYVCTCSCAHVKKPNITASTYNLSAGGARDMRLPEACQPVLPNQWAPSSLRNHIWKENMKTGRGRDPVPTSGLHMHRHVCAYTHKYGHIHTQNKKMDLHIYSLRFSHKIHILNFFNAKDWKPAPMST